MDPRTAILLARIRHWNQTHGPKQQIDPQAELRVARVEGLSGGIGDGGHAFGPNQENDAGGVLTGKLAGLTPQQKNAWAWSPQGIDSALAGVAAAAGAEHGDRAVQDIVTRYERPADPRGEIARALGLAAPQLGGGASLGDSSTPGDAAAADPTARRQALLSLIGSIGNQGSSVAPLLQAIRTFKNSAPAAGDPSLGTGSLAPPTGKTGSLAELLLEGTGGPTHSTGPHVHVASTDPQTMLAVIQLAQRLGLHAGENPYVGGVASGVHAPHSFHDVTFPGVYNGRKLGEATDFSGPGMQRFYQLVRQRYGAPTR